MTSTIGVKKIQHTNGTQVMTFDTAGKISSNVSSTGNITTTGTINTPSINGGQIGGRRNIIINGAMQIAQRNTTQASIGGNQAYWTLDRYYLNAAGTDGRLTMSQSAITDLEGFSNALKLDCTTADTSIAAGEVLILQQRVEGFDVQQLKATSTSTRAFTLSFYAKSNASRAIVSEINLTNGTNRQISKLHTIGTSWARYTMTIPAASSTQIDNDNSHELSVNFWLHAGSTYTSGTLNDDALDSITNANRAAGIGSFFSSTDNTFEITGIQLELGETATAFEHRSIGEELQLCKRYFQVLADGSRSQNEAICAGTYYTASVLFHSVVLPVEMRAQPTMVTTNGTNYYITFANGSGDHHDAIARSGNSSKSVVEITAETNVSGTSGHGCFTRIGGTSSDAKCMFDAEL